MENAYFITEVNFRSMDRDMSQVFSNDVLHLGIDFDLDGEVLFG